jgi:hypothetical protein
MSDGKDTEWWRWVVDSAAQGVRQELERIKERRDQGQDLDTVKLERFVPVTPEKAMWGWLRNVWQGGGGLGLPKMIDFGDRYSRVGCKRDVGKCGASIIETILAADVPEPSSTVLRIVYEVEGCFPVDYHRGVVPLLPPLAHRNASANPGATGGGSL